MAWELPSFSVTLPWASTAAASSTGHQFRFVTIDANGRVGLPATTADVKPIGVLQNLPTAQDTGAIVMVAGVSKVQAPASTLAVGDRCAASTAGQAVVLGTSNAPPMVGYVVGGSSGSAGRILSVLLLPWGTTA
jgi:hypothetical protein